MPDFHERVCFPRMSPQFIGNPDMLLRVVDQEVDVGVDLHGALNRAELPLVQREPLAHRRSL
jgi:hypothetical protein